MDTRLNGDGIARSLVWRTCLNSPPPLKLLKRPVCDHVRSQEIPNVAWVRVHCSVRLGFILSKSLEGKVIEAFAFAVSYISNASRVMAMKPVLVAFDWKSAPQLRWCDPPSFQRETRLARRWLMPFRTLAACLQLPIFSKLSPFAP